MRWERAARSCGAWLGLATLSGACGTEPPEPPPPVPVRVVITAADTITVTGRTLTFSAVAVDSVGAVVPRTIHWSVSDSSRGRITAGGMFTAGPDSGRTYVRASVTMPSLAESVAVRVVVPGTVRWTWAATGADPSGRFPMLGGPALAPDGTVYVLVEHAPGTDVATLVALTADGAEKWKLALGSLESDYPVVTATGDVLVVGKVTYVVRPDGTVRWQQLMEAATPAFKSGAAREGVAFVAHGFHVTAFDLATGDTVWQSALSPLGEWSVPPTLVGAAVVYAKHSEDTLFAFRQSDGTILKTFLDPDTGVDKRVFGAGTVPVADRIYLPTWSRLAAFDTAGPLLWLTDEVGRGMTEPAVSPAGVLYVQNRRWGTQAINPDGTTRWHGPGGPYWTWYGGPALARGGIVYSAAYSGFYAHDAAGAVLWSRIVDSAGTVQAFTGAPAIAPDGSVYTFTSTDLYAFWGPSPPEPNSPWPMWRHDAQRTGWVR